MDKAQIKITILDEILKTKLSITNNKEVTKPIPPNNDIVRISRIDAINKKSITNASLR